MSSTAIHQFVDDLRAAFEAGDELVAHKAVEEACVALVQDQYRALARGDFAAFLDTLADDIELENVGPPALPFVGRWQGRDQVAEAVQRNFSLIEDQRPEVLSLVAQGDTVVVVARERGRVRSTGQEYDMHWVQMLTYRERRLVKFRQVFDSGSILHALTGSATPGR